MNAVKLFRSTLAVDPAFPDRWFVTNGVGAIGPVELALVARGIEAGKVDVESCFVRHESWKVWRSLAELAVRPLGFDDESGVFEKQVR